MISMGLMHPSLPRSRERSRAWESQPSAQTGGNPNEVVELKQRMLAMFTPLEERRGRFQPDNALLSFRQSL